MAVWISWNIDIRRSLNCRDSVPRRKFKNRAATSCSPGPILWPPTISFELDVKMAEEIDLEMCTYGQLSDVQMLSDLDLGSGKSHINVQFVEDYQLAQPRDCSITRYRNMVVWISWNIDIRRSFNCRDSFPKYKNRAPTSCSTGPTLWPSTISFELDVKMAEEIDLEMCTYGQLSEVQMLSDLDLGSGQSHINVHSASRTISLPNHVTVASRTTQIWPFECREILTFGEVWTVLIAFPEGNSKIGLRQAVVQVPYYDHQPSVSSSTPKRRRR